MLQILLMYAFLSATFLISKDLVALLNPLFIVFIRMLGCSIAFGLFSFFLQGASPKITLSYLRSVFIVGFFNGYLSNVFQIFGLEHIDSINASLWCNSAPFIIALLYWLIYKTHITKMRIFSLIIGWCSFIPLLIQNSHQNFSSYGMGAFYFILAALATAISTLMLEKDREIMRYPMSLTNAFVTTIGGICAFVHYYFIKTTISFIGPLTHLSYSNGAVLIFLIIATIIGAALNFSLLRKHGALLVTFAGFTLPIFSGIFEFIFLGKKTFNLSLILSILLITCALYLFTRKGKGEQKSI